MIHDIILSLLSEKESNVIKELMNLEVSSNFIHPAEMKTLADINKITNQYRDIRKFVALYSTCANENSQLALEIESNSMPVGFYLQAFANGLDQAIEPYHDAVVDLEKKFLRKPTLSLMFIFHEMEKFRPLFEFLSRMISSVKTQKLFGCKILQYLQDNVLHGDKTIMKAVQVIQRSVYTIFIQHLCQWVMYGKFIDVYGEFFIQHVELNRSSDRRPALSTQTSISTFQSSEPSVNLDLWHYEINFNMLPHYFPRSWAEKVLFIGQTVLMFNSDPRESVKNFANDSDYLEDTRKQSVWGDQEQTCFKKFHKLQEADKLTVLTFEQIIDDIKICVTEHLSEIAITEADLTKQLRLIKDFYLLGRGELFYEFIRILKPNFINEINDNTIRDINRIFQVAANSVNIHDDVELFSFERVQQDENESYNFEIRGLFDALILRYKIKWPLHLLFSPMVLEKYNELFRFLIRIKKVQHDLHVVWSHHREAKVERSNELLQFRNKLMFIIDNLQYYLQVDVLESQFSIMMGKIEETKDFEQIQRAHSCFQANILGLCFLLDIPDSSSTKTTLYSATENPVFTILNKILLLIDNFTVFAYICTNPMTIDDKQAFDNFEELFANFVESLLRMLTGLQASAPLAQLLLRLDFNYWFSSQAENE